MNRTYTLVLGLAILLAATPALADQAAPPIPGTPPAGWRQSQEHAQVVHSGILAGLPPEITAANVRVYSYSAPQGGGQVIFSVLDVGTPDDASAAAFVRARVDELHHTPQMMVDDGGGRVREISWQEHTDDPNRVVDALLEWAHDDNGTQSVVRSAWVKVPVQPGSAKFVIEEVRAECVLAADAVATLRPVCADAIASMLMPEPSVRLPITAAAVAPTINPDTPSMTPTPPGTQVPARPVVEPSPKRDWRPFYVLGVLIVIVGVLMWNKRRREAYDEESEHKDEAEANAPDGKDEEQP